MSVGCVVEVVPEIVEALVKHEGILRKLIKTLRQCCCTKTTSSGSEGVNEEALNSLIEETVNQMDALCDGKVEWATKDRRQWHKLAKKLVQYGYWEECVAKDVPWRTVSVTKPPAAPNSASE
jgi:hypothetical protein